MTATAATFDPGLGVIPSEEAHAIDQVALEARCTPAEARNLLEWIRSIVHEARRTDYQPQLPTTSDMSGRTYLILDHIMPHASRSRPGSAHAALEAALLDQNRGELAIMHDNRSAGAEMPLHCEVEVIVLR